MDSAQMVEALNLLDPAHAGTLRHHPFQLKVEGLPFYQHTRLVRAVVMLPHRPHELHYLEREGELLVTDGSVAALYQVNAQEELHVEADQVAAYLRFFFENTGGAVYQLVQAFADAPWLARVSSDPSLKRMRTQAASRFHPVRITPTDEGYRVKATVLRGTSLLELELTLAFDGKVDVQRLTLLYEDVPVAAPG